MILPGVLCTVFPDSPPSTRLLKVVDLDRDGRGLGGEAEVFCLPVPAALDARFKKEEEMEDVGTGCEARLFCWPCDLPLGVLVEG